MAAAGYQADPRSLVDGREALSQAIEDPLVVEAWSKADDEASYPEWAADSLAGWEDRARSLMAAGIPEPLAVKRSAMVFGSLGADGDFMAAAKNMAINHLDLEAVADAALAKEFSPYLREPVQKADPNWDESSVNRDVQGRFSEEEERGIMIDGKLYAIAEQGQAEREPVKEAVPAAKRVSDETLLASADELRLQRERRKRRKQRKLARAAAAQTAYQHYQAEQERIVEEQRQQESQQTAGEESEEAKRAGRALKRKQLRHKLRKQKMIADTSASEESKAIDQTFEEAAKEGTPVGEFLAQYQKIVTESRNAEYLKKGISVFLKTMSHTQVADVIDTGQQPGVPKLYPSNFLVGDARKLHVPIPVTIQNENDFLGMEHIPGPDIQVALNGNAYPGRKSDQVIEGDDWVYKTGINLLNLERFAQGTKQPVTEEHQRLYELGQELSPSDRAKAISFAASWHMNRILEEAPENALSNDAYVMVSAIMAPGDPVEDRRNLLVKYSDLKNFMRAHGGFATTSTDTRLKNFYVLETPIEESLSNVTDPNSGRMLHQHRFVHHPDEERIYQLAVQGVESVQASRDLDTKSASADEPVTKLEAIWDESEVNRDQLGRFAIERDPDEEEAKRRAYRERVRQRNARKARRIRRAAAAAGAASAYQQVAIARAPKVESASTAEERQDALLSRADARKNARARLRAQQRAALQRERTDEAVEEAPKLQYSAREIEVISGKAENPIMAELLRITGRSNSAEYYPILAGLSDGTKEFSPAEDDRDEARTDSLDRWAEAPNKRDAQRLSGSTFIREESREEIDRILLEHQEPENQGTYLQLHFLGNGRIDRPFDLESYEFIHPQVYEQR